MTLAKERKTKSAFHFTTVLRLLPLALVGLLPYHPLDEALLHSLYSLRGESDAPESLKTFTYSSSEELGRFLSQMRTTASGKCFVLLSDERLNTDPCLNLSIEDFYSADLLPSHYSKARKYLGAKAAADPTAYQPFFLGKMEHFNPEPLNSLLSSTHPALLRNEFTYVLMPSFFKAKIKIQTGVGPLSAPEIALNVVANAYEQKQLLSSSKSLQFFVCLSTALISASILYSYPIFLTMLFLLGFAAAQIALGVFVLDRLQFSMPLASSFVTLIVTYLVGMSDRLDRRERREWSLEQEAQSLEKLDEMRNNFLSLVSHDLKTPIAKMQSLLEQFSRGDFGVLSPQQQEEVQKALSTNGHLKRSILTLLLLNRVESRELKIHFQPTDLKELLETVAQTYLLQAKERKVSIHLELETLFLVDLDQELIREVVHNLIGNALKYSPAGSRVTLRCGEIDLCPELSPPQAGIWFEVQDEGPGISPEDRKKVFRKFERGSSQNAPLDQSIAGTGLGLFLTQYFVEQHHGKVLLISRTHNEKTAAGPESASYFDEKSNQTGTVMRVVLPIEPFEML